MSENCGEMNEFKHSKFDQMTEVTSTCELVAGLRRVENGNYLEELHNPEGP